MPNDLGPLLSEVRRALQMNQLKFAELIGSSKRTVQRIEGGRAWLSGNEAALAVRALHPQDPELAGRLAAFCSITLAAAGIAAVASSSAASRGAIDSVLCAAADVLDLSPRAVRPALLAALARARDLGLGMDALLATLSQADAPAPSPASDRSP
jgi:hypothetical protein